MPTIEVRNNKTGKVIQRLELSDTLAAWKKGQEISTRMRAAEIPVERHDIGDRRTECTGSGQLPRKIRPGALVSGVKLDFVTNQGHVAVMEVADVNLIASCSGCDQQLMLLGSVNPIWRRIR